MTPQNKSLLKKGIAWVSSIAGIATVYTSLVYFFDLELRPAWAWELAELNKQQKEFQIEFYQFDKRTLNDQIFDNKRLQKEYENKNKEIPNWILREEQELLEDRELLNNRIQRLQNEILKDLE